ncbi:RING/FYVE/PHD zinc finger superfamily protein [Rhynchospora pubera]|uniref:RING/FYVE/PHD zinc finger superfamily protein n=1 Tax=Rhynchospora pubera TaxID=906938 RepID=A0AAV8FL98_9POAL|nr:RING/FYVE/PHD zinc finger superfamily protein [Rhynchospora pubera]
MGDHLALLVDRLLTESTLEAAIKSRKQTQFGPVSPLSDNDTCQPESSNISNFGEVGPPRKLVECRICQEEDFDLNLEAPCSCCGSLKYAHRKCIQRWCNEKGDTTCEICLQQFKPGYTAPQHLFHYGSLPMNFRGSWEVSRQDVQDSQVITMVPSHRDVTGEYDEYSTRTTSSICCRSVAITFMILLVLRHMLPILIDEQYSFALFSLLVLRVAGVIFPIVVMARALMAFHRRRRQQQEAREVDTSTDTEADTIWMHPRIMMHPRIIQLH